VGAERRPRRTGVRIDLKWVALAGIVAAHLALAVLLFDPTPFVGGDNANYMILAESIGSGQGYRDLYLPGAPRHAQYPPLYPLVLAIARGFGGGLIGFKILSVIFTATSVVFLFLLAERRLKWVSALAVTAAFALNPVLLYYSHWVLSEAPFVLLTLVGLWAGERLTDSWRWVTAAVAAALLAYLTRAAGLPLVAAMVIALAWRRSWGRLAAAGTAAGLVILAWWAWGKLVAAQGVQTYSSNFLLLDPYRPELGYIGPGDLLARVVENVRLYAIEVLPESLAGVGRSGGVNPIAVMLALFVAGLAFLAWVRDVRRLRALEVFTLLYMGLICLWPQVWTDRRFLLPLLPVLLLHAAGGLEWCFDFVRVRRPAWAVPVFGALLILLAAPDHARAVSFSQRCLTLYRQGDRLACYPPPWRSFVQAAEWVRENTPENAVVISRKPTLFYYWGRRRGNVYPFTSDDDAMLAFLDSIGAQYVVVANLSATTARYLVPVVRGHAEQFELVQRVGPDEAPAFVLGYHKTGAQPGPGEGR
jgi:hypothetical protein